MAVVEEGEPDTELIAGPITTGIKNRINANNEGLANINRSTFICMYKRLQKETILGLPLQNLPHAFLEANKQ